MTKLRKMLLGAALALPLAAFGVLGTAATADQDAVVPPSVPDGSSSAIECCWIFISGRWWCISYCS